MKVFPLTLTRTWCSCPYHFQLLFPVRELTVPGSCLYRPLVIFWKTNEPRVVEDGWNWKTYPLVTPSVRSFYEVRK